MVSQFVAPFSVLDHHFKTRTFVSMDNKEIKPHIVPEVQRQIYCFLVPANLSLIGLCGDLQQSPCFLLPSLDGGDCPQDCGVSSDLQSFLWARWYDTFLSQGCGDHAKGQQWSLASREFLSSGRWTLVGDGHGGLEMNGSSSYPLLNHLIWMGISDVACERYTFKL